MKREEWGVPYSGQTLLTAVEQKKAFHEQRSEWWREKKDELIEKIRSEGIVVTESIVDELAKGGYSTLSNAGRDGPNVQIDTGLLAQLREAHAKVHEHKAKTGQYDAWRQMLAAHPNSQFDLDHEDWMFFFGK